MTGHKVVRLDEMTGHELNEDLINFLELMNTTLTLLKASNQNVSCDD